MSGEDISLTMPPSLLTAYDLGASGSLLRAIFQNEKVVQRAIDPAKNGSRLDGVPSVGGIDPGNWRQWLGDERYVLVTQSDALLKLSSEHMLLIWLSSKTSSLNMGSRSL